MRRIGLAALAALLVGSAAVADVQPRSNLPAAPPLSVWRVASGGDAEHLQSGLACPQRVQGYVRTELHVYDRWGLDVSCNYGRPGSDVTVYLTRYPAALTVDQIYASAKQSFLQARAGMGPRLRSETHPSIGGLAWDLAIYDDNGGVADMVWAARLQDWTLQYRITYRASDESRVMADMATWTDAVVASAGARLARCATNPASDGAGVAITDAKVLEGDSVIAPLLTFGSVNGAPPGGRPGPEIAWCIDHTGSAGSNSLILWRGALPDGSDANMDRITAIAQGAALELIAQPALPTGVIPGGSGGAGRWVATITDGSRTSYYGSFTARPTPAALGGLYVDILEGRARPLSSYDGHTVTVSLPSK